MYSIFTRVSLHIISGRDNDLAAANDWQFIKFRWNASANIVTALILIDFDRRRNKPISSFPRPPSPPTFFFLDRTHSTAIVRVTIGVQLISKSDRMKTNVVTRRCRIENYDGNVARVSGILVITRIAGYFEERFDNEFIEHVYSCNLELVINSGYY